MPCSPSGNPTFVISQKRLSIFVQAVFSATDQTQSCVPLWTYNQTSFVSHYISRPSAIHLATDRSIHPFIRLFILETTSSYLLATSVYMPDAHIQISTDRQTDIRTCKRVKGHNEGLTNETTDRWTDDG